MKRFALHFSIFFFIFAIFSPAMAEKRVALVIGNSAYKHTQTLPNPKNDAKALTSKLKRLGFEVLGGTDLTRNEFNAAIIDFADKLQQADVGLFFYAGHGLQVAGQNYLVPIDAKLTKAAHLKFSMVKLNDVLEQMENSTKTNLIFIDACRDNPLARNLARAMGRSRSGSIGRGLAAVHTGIGTMITFATQPGNVALDETRKNSPFTSALLKHIETPGLDIAPLLRSVRRDVIKATRRSQVPWNHSSLTDSFYFKGAEQSPKKKVRSEPVRSSDAAREWRSLQGSNDIGDLQAYIAQFSKRFPYYGHKAKKKLKILKEQRVAVDIYSKQPVLDRPVVPSARRRLSYEPETVRIPGKTFSMSKYEITVGQFKVFVKATGHKMGNCSWPSSKSWRHPGFSQSNNHPVVCVSSNDAVAYAKWLSRKTGQKWRLPKEAEWEYAARAGSKTKYHFGDNRSDLGKYAWYDKNSGGEAHPVGKKRPNAFGLYDVHGNALEWCQNFYSKSGLHRVLRGGSWDASAGYLRSAYSSISSPDSRDPSLGFRLLRQP